MPFLMPCGLSPAIPSLLGVREVRHLTRPLWQLPPSVRVKIGTNKPNRLQPLASACAENFESDQTSEIGFDIHVYMRDLIRGAVDSFMALTLGKTGPSAFKPSSVPSEVTDFTPIMPSNTSPVMPSSSLPFASTTILPNFNFQPNFTVPMMPSAPMLPLGRPSMESAYLEYIMYLLLNQNTSNLLNATTNTPANRLPTPLPMSLSLPQVPTSLSVSYSNPVVPTFLPSSPDRSRSASNLNTDLEAPHIVISDMSLPYLQSTISKNKLGRSYNPGRPLAMSDRQRILELYEKGHKISHIARIIGVTHSCVSKIMTRYRRTGSMHPRSAQQAKKSTDSLSPSSASSSSSAASTASGSSFSSSNSSGSMSPQHMGSLELSEPSRFSELSLTEVFGRHSEPQTLPLFRGVA